MSEAADDGGGNLLVGTAGMSVWFSDRAGEHWARPYSESGLYLEARVWALSAHPDAPGTAWAGTDDGLYRCDVAAKKWSHVPSPMDGACIWALAQSPANSDVLIAGTQPAALYRSDDAGATWRQLPCSFAETCIYVHRPRVTQIVFDPKDPDSIWVGVEIDGIHHSGDGGETWSRRNEGLKSEDIHGLAVLADGNRRRLFATTNKGLHVSDDEGGSWQFQAIESPWQYTRSVIPAPGRPDTLFLTNGNGPPGDAGRLYRSDDAGRSWQKVELPAEPNSTPWCMAVSPEDPDLMFLASNLGQLWRSDDGGAHWQKLKRELGEVRAILWQPAPELRLT